jgi:hypothetical protein
VANLATADEPSLATRTQMLITDRGCAVAAYLKAIEVTKVIASNKLSGPYRGIDS